MAAGYTSVLEATAWTNRDDQFGALRVFDDGRPIVVMELAPKDRRDNEWDALKRRWLELLPHHHILDAIDHDGKPLLLRYAAIDWHTQPVELETARGRRLVATWGRQLVDAYIAIAAQFPTEAGHFMRPLAVVDFANRARLGFLPTTPYETWIPRGVTATWPACDEAGLAYATACVVREMSQGSTLATAEPIKSILMRALGLSGRPYTLAALREAFDEIAFAPLDEDHDAALAATEEGLGWLHVGESRRASPQFIAALRFRPELLAAKEGLARCRSMQRTGELHGPLPEADHLALAQDHELRGQLQAAAYRWMQLTKRQDLAVLGYTGAARCQLEIAPEAALRAAKAALAIDPRHREALSYAIRTALALKLYTEVVELGDRELDDAGVHYARGRALLVLKRYVEAREAFDRACTLEPKRIEAMLLRREADRMVRRIAGVVGVARPMHLDLPEHLASLRDPLAAGRVDEVIPTLEAMRDDGSAQLVLAECFAYVQRYEEALVGYRRAIELEPRPRAREGVVRALLFLDRASEAEAELAHLDDSREASELRALVRQRL